MSWVTNVLLHMYDEFDEDSHISEVNRYFEATGTFGLVSIDDPKLPRGWYGGSKMFEATLYAGAYNSLNLDQFVQHLKAVAWSHPEYVQLIVREQEADGFRIIKIVGGDN